METLREAFKDNTRTKTLRLIEKFSGRFIARLPIEEALEQYGDWIYCNGYSESFTELSVWIFNTTK